MSEKSDKSWLWPALGWCLGLLGMIGIWLGISIWVDSTCFWMAVIAVIDIALILRFTGVHAGWRRFFAVLAGAAIIVIASQWLIAANAFGLVLGLFPLEAAQMVGPVLVWEFTRLRIQDADAIYLLIALALAWQMGLRRPK